MAEGNNGGTGGNARKSAQSTKTRPSNPQPTVELAKSLQTLTKKSFSAEDANPLPDPVHGVGSRVDDAINGLLLHGTPYRVGRIIGSGLTGQVRLARNIKTNQQLAVKIEIGNAEYQLLQKEWEMYKVLHTTKAPGIPKAFHYGTCGVYQALVLELLGPSLQEIFLMSERKFSLHTVLLIAIQLITRLQYIHTKKIINRDIKPENLLIRKPPSRDNTIFIVDFGLAKYYVDPATRKHIPYRGHKNLTGTAQFMSLNTLMGMEQSRRDDLESLGYTLIYFLRGSLPWEGVRNGPTQDHYKQILDSKTTFSLEKLCEGHPPEFVQYMEYVRKLKFDQSPDYNYLRNIFNQRLQKHRYDPAGDMDWIGVVGDEKLMHMSERLYR